MPFSVDSTLAPAILRITLSEDWPSREEQRVWRLTSMKSGLLTPTTKVLIDARPLKRFPHFHEMDAVIAAAVSEGSLPLYRAYLASPGIQFGIFRQFQLMAPKHITVEVFTELQEAEHWLTR